MKHSLFRAGALALALGLTGCGNDGSESSSSTNSSPAADSGPSLTASGSGSAVKGIIRHGHVRALHWINGHYEEVGAAQTDDAGQFSISFSGATPGIVKLVMTLSTDTSAPTQMRCDAPAGCGSTAFGDWLTLTENPGLESWGTIDSSGILQTTPLTPLSTLVVRYAESLNAGLNAQTLAFARQRLTAALGIPADTLQSSPGDITNALWLATANEDAKRLSLLSAAFAQLSATSGKSLKDLIDQYAAALISQNGHLLEAAADDSPSIAMLLQGTKDVSLALAGSPAQDIASALAQRLASLQLNALNTLPAPSVSSENLLTALGPLGQDIREVMAASGASSLEGLILSELSQFKWLATQDSLTLAGNAIEVVVYGLVGAKLLDIYAGYPLAPSSIPLINDNGYVVTLYPASKTMSFSGTRNGFDTSLTISIPSLSSAIKSGTFSVGANGVLSNGSIKASINGTLGVDAHDTDLSALGAAINTMLQGGSVDPTALMTSLSTLLKHAHGVFTLNGSAGLESLIHSGSKLAIAGNASADVDMDGNAGGISVVASVTKGSLELPNGDVFTVREGIDKLSLTMKDDIRIDAAFQAKVLTLPLADVSGTATLSKGGKLISQGRDTVTAQLDSGTLDLSQLLSAIVSLDYSQLHLTASGTANISSTGKLYRLSLDGSTMTINQPNSTEIAMTLGVGRQGITLAAGDYWMLFSPQLNPLGITIADSTGAESVLTPEVVIASLP